MDRKEQFANWLALIGGIILIVDTVTLYFLSSWFLAGIGSLFILALIIYGLAIWISKG